MEIQQIELGALASDMFEMLRRMLGETIRIDVDVAADIWDAVADKGLTEGALPNLAINARDAMPEGGQITIRASNRALSVAEAARLDASSGDYVALSEIDTGSGVAPHVVEHAFDPFFTTKEMGRGTGLGLSMVYGLVKQCGGTVEIDSEPGLGTAITIFLPRAYSALDVKPDQDKDHEEAVPEAEKILVVDNDADVRELAVLQLRGMGYRVDEAENVQQALARLADDAAIGLLFTDVKMSSGMSGLELWHLAEPLRPGLKVIFTSGGGDHAISSSQSPEDDFPFVRKPYKRDELSHVVRKTLARESSGEIGAGRTEK